MAYIECDLDHKVPSIYDTLDIESKNTLDMTYIKGYSFPVKHVGKLLCLPTLILLSAFKKEKANES